MSEFKTGKLVCLDCGKKLRYVEVMGTLCVDMCKPCREIVITLALNGAYDNNKESKC